MTVQETIDVFEKPSDHIKTIQINHVTGILYSADLVKAFEMAIGALEKQIPKKPIIQKMKILDCIDQIQIFNKKICPSCGTVLCADWNFCFECGQKLDWE